MLRTADTHPWRIADTNWLQVGAQLALAGLWLALFRPVGDYLLMILSHEHYHTNQIMLIGILVLAVQQMVGRPLRLRLDAPPRLHWPPLLLALGAALGFLVVERFLDVNSFSAVLAGLATYGLLGLWMPLPAWRRSLPVALLLIGVLPFGDHLQTFIGYPMRIVTAAIVRDGLAAAGVHTVGVDTILVFENGISQVDIPCSGVKSLWSGMMFLLAATWIRHKPINLRWLLVAGVFGVLLFAANLARVAALVVVGPVAGWPLLAEMLHLPLGVLGFAAACAAAVALLDRWVAHATTPGEHAPAHTTPGLQPAWLTPALIIAVAALAWLYTPRPADSAGAAITHWQFPAELSTQPLPLTAAERDWLMRDGAEAAERWRFDWRGLRGSFIIVTSRTWRAHHQPERCFEVYGLSLDDSRTHLVDSDFPLRFVALGDGDHHSVLSASYWFQSTAATTDDYGARIWSDLSTQRTRWVLVSILFDSVVDPSAVDVAALYRGLQQAVAQNLVDS